MPGPELSSSAADVDPVPSLRDRVVDDLKRFRFVVDQSQAIREKLGKDRQVDSWLVGLDRALATVDVANATASPDLVVDLAAADPGRFARSYGGFVAALDSLETSNEAAVTRSEDVTPTRLRAVIELLTSRLLGLASSREYLFDSARRATAEEQLRSEADKFSRDIINLRDQVAVAASEFGLDVQKLDWGQYANEETRLADRWRSAAVAFLGSAFILSLLGVMHLLGSRESWVDLVLKALAVASLAGLAGYAAAQSAEHRRASRYARQNAIDLATISPFVAQLPDPNRVQVLTAFGLVRFGHPSSSGVDTGQGGDAAGHLVEVLKGVLSLRQ